MARVYYSTNTWLAYRIAEQYYGSVNYVWCSPVFDHRMLGVIDRTTPPTSSPAEIYFSLADEVTNGDRHSSKIEANRLGIIRGAGVQRREGRITDMQYGDIVGIVNQTERMDFRPLLFVIPEHGVEELVTEVPVFERAHPLSKEFVITDLPRNLFDVIELRRW
jgi:hypothetical protein